MGCTSPVLEQNTLAFQPATASNRHHVKHGLTFKLPAITSQKTHVPVQHRRREIPLE